MVSHDLGYLPAAITKPILAKAAEIAKMLHGPRSKVARLYEYAIRSTAGDLQGVLF